MHEDRPSRVALSRGYRRLRAGNSGGQPKFHLLWQQVLERELTQKRSLALLYWPYMSWGGCENTIS